MKRTNQVFVWLVLLFGLIMSKKTKTKKVKKLDRNLVAVVRARQARERLSMQEGEPESLDDRITDSCRNLMHLNVMVYKYSQESAIVFEKLIRATKIISEIYMDKELKTIANKAEAAINELQKDGSDDLSLNQRREILFPVVQLIDAIDIYGEWLPAKTVEIVAHYCAAAQVMIFTKLLLPDAPSTNKKPVLLHYLAGVSIKTMADDLNWTEPEVRICILKQAYLLYRIIECANSSINYPYTLNDIRKKAWKVWDKPAILEFADNCYEQYCIPFQDRTGITFFPRGYLEE